MNNFALRTITGSVFVLLIVASILINQYSFLALFSFIVFLSIIEFYRVSIKARIRAQMIPGTIAAVLIFGFSFLFASGKADSKIFLFLIPLFILFFILELFRREKNPFGNLAFTIFGLLYIAMPFAMFNSLVFPTGFEYKSGILLGFFILLWSNDTGAYLVGRAIGKHRLFVRISPKKSWEGFFGGMILSMGIAALCSALFNELSMGQWIGTAIIICIFATFGDLSESLMKRSITIKDSGSILPGHGGILDRFDSVFLAAPAVFFYLKLIL